MPHQEGKVVHVRPHDIFIEKSKTESAAPATLKDWQHLGAMIRLELVKNASNGLVAFFFAEMPNDQFKQLKLNRGDKVDLRIRQAHWFN